MLDTAPWNITASATDQVFLGVNPRRRRITISPPSAGRVTIQFGRAAVLDQGITVQVGTPTRTVTEDDVGYAIHSEVHIIADAGGRIVGGTEAFKAGP